MFKVSIWVATAVAIPPSTTPVSWPVLPWYQFLSPNNIANDASIQSLTVASEALVGLQSNRLDIFLDHLRPLGGYSGRGLPPSRRKVGVGMDDSNMSKRAYG